MNNIDKIMNEFHNDIKRWIKENNWIGGKCKLCGKELFPIIDFKEICAICMNNKIIDKSNIKENEHNR
ncbi:MAG: hypothetical protein EHM34_00210 [Nitrosopumilales archaeon]|nr:MAG: hypothetical protein EHM34_00210 [Nitrosopumilales archaeon]